MNWTERLLTGWDFMRGLRLVLAVFIGVQAIRFADPLAGMISALFLFQVVTNTGCFGSQGCAVPTTNKSPQTDDVTYEEIKTDSKK